MADHNQQRCDECKYFEIDYGPPPMLEGGPYLCVAPSSEACGCDCPGTKPYYGQRCGLYVLAEVEAVEHNKKWIAENDEKTYELCGRYKDVKTYHELRNL